MELIKGFTEYSRRDKDEEKRKNQKNHCRCDRRSPGSGDDRADGASVSDLTGSNNVMKTDRKKGILLGLCMMAVGIFCMNAKVQAAETETSQVSVTSESAENPNSQGEDISDGSVRTDDKETIPV